MNQSLATTEERFSQPSLRKQRLYRKYTTGELSWLQVADEIEKIRPPTNYSWKQRTAVAISAFLVAVLIPPWVRLDD